MKKSMLLSIVACAITVTTMQGQITRNVNTQDYDKIDARGSMNVVLQKGTEGAIQIIAEEKAQEYVTVESNGKTLSISLKKNLYKVSKKGVKIIVPFSDLNQVSLKGSGEVTSKEIINASTFVTHLNGSGDVDLKVAATNVEASLNGSGNINISGNATNLEVSMTGSGDIDALQLRSQNTDANLTGSGDITVHASNNINAILRGSGDIEFAGNPETKNTKVYGSGDIGPRN